MEDEIGLIHIYCGDGKGKTTAAFGLALRCIGRGKKVIIAQFLKNGESGEVEAIRRFGKEIVEMYYCNPFKKFYKNMTEEEIKITREKFNEMFEDIIKKCEEEKAELLILDEIIASINHKLINEAKVINYLDNKPKWLEIVMTGRNPKKEYIKRADYVSEIKKIKHPYDRGIKARKGIEK